MNAVWAWDPGLIYFAESAYTYYIGVRLQLRRIYIV